MAYWLNLGQNLRVNAKKFPDTVAFKERERAFTYPEANRRINRLAHGLRSLGLRKGDKVAVLLENCIEIVEVYLATAKTGQKSSSNPSAILDIFDSEKKWILGPVVLIILTIVSIAAYRYSIYGNVESFWYVALFIVFFIAGLAYLMRRIMDH